MLIVWQHLTLLWEIDCARTHLHRIPLCSVETRTRKSVCARMCITGASVPCVCVLVLFSLRFMPIEHSERQIKNNYILFIWIMFAQCTLFLGARSCMCALWPQTECTSVPFSSHSEFRSFSAAFCSLAFLRSPNVRGVLRCGLWCAKALSDFNYVRPNGISTRANVLLALLNGCFGVNVIWREYAREWPAKKEQSK